MAEAGRGNNLLHLILSVTVDDLLEQLKHRCQPDSPHK